MGSILEESNKPGQWFSSQLVQWVLSGLITSNDMFKLPISPCRAADTQLSGHILSATLSRSNNVRVVSTSDQCWDHDWWSSLVSRVREACSPRSHLSSHPAMSLLIQINYEIICSSQLNEDGNHISLTELDLQLISKSTQLVLVQKIFIICKNQDLSVKAIKTFAPKSG